MTTHPTGFHAHSGWFFRRGDGGLVTIYADSSDGEAREVTFEPSTWASIVASVSAQGEATDQYHRALGLHSGEPL